MISNVGFGIWDFQICNVGFAQLRRISKLLPRQHYHHPPVLILIF